MKKYLLLLLPSLAFFICTAQTKPAQPQLKLYKVEKNYKDKSIGFITESGEIKVPCIYEEAGEFMDGVAWFYQDNKFGLINSFGDVIAPAEYDFIGDMSSGVAVIKTNGKYGLISKTGKILVEPIYQRIARFSDGLAPVQSADKWGYINSVGKIVIQPKFERAYVFREGLAKVIIERKDKFLDGGFINKTGQVVIPCKFYTGKDNISTLDEGFSQGLAKASLDGEKWGFINKTGSFVIKPVYTSVSDFKDGVSMAWSDDGNSIGYIDTKGSIVVGFEYELGFGFSEGLAAVKIPGKESWGYINKKKQLVNDGEYTDVSNFTNGVAKVVDQNGAAFYIDKGGNFFHSYYSEDIVENITNMYVGSSSAYYTGKLVNGLPEGFGKVNNADGSWYEGSYKAGLRHGLGTFRSTEGLRYYGNWVNDKADGVFQVKQWTLGGVVSNEWYAKYDMGNLISSEQTKADFDNFINNRNSSTASTNTNKEPEPEQKKKARVEKFESSGEASIMSTKAQRYYVKFSDGTSGNLYRYYEKDGGKWFIYDGLAKTYEYKTKDEALEKLYEYKKGNIF